jgi:hypothetical protein
MALSDRWGDGGWKSQWSPEVETGVVRTRYANPIRQPLRSIGWSTCPPKQRIADSNPEVHKRSGWGATNQAEDGIISEIHHQSAVIRLIYNRCKCHFSNFWGQSWAFPYSKILILFNFLKLSASPLKPTGIKRSRVLLKDLVDATAARWLCHELNRTISR